MFDLESSITNWREQMFAAGIPAAALDELEIHLREEIEQQIKSGADGHTALKIATCQIGNGDRLQAEFKKIETRGATFWLVAATWLTFVISFLLPAYGTDHGWQCAGLAAATLCWSNSYLIWQDWYLASLTIANLWMLSSPFWLTRLSKKGQSWKWMCALTCISLILPWSYLGLLLYYAGGEDLRMGAYVWAFSFLLLNVAMYVRPESKEQYV